MTTRAIHRLIPAQSTSDGAGVRIRRSLGANPLLRHDPFLMLDEFFSDNPEDYIAGFPSHPHRGFETVTYMLDGHMRHEDHLGNRGDLGPGDVQWMTAGRGIIHSEMPQQTEGRMRGFQLWINLPGREKMKPASYQDIPANDIPLVSARGNSSVRVIAGSFASDGTTVPGPVAGITTEPLFLDVHLGANETFEAEVAVGHNAFLYAYEGTLRVGAEHDEIRSSTAALLSDGDTVTVSGGAVGARFLLLAARPIGEPVVQYGPFVMTTREEVERAMADYRDGALTG